MIQKIIYPPIKNFTNEDDIRCLRAAYIMANSVPPILPSANNHINEDLMIFLSVSPTKALVRVTVTIEIKRTEKNKNMGHFLPAIKIEPVKPTAVQIPRG